MTGLGLVHAHNPLAELTLHPLAPTSRGGLAPATLATMGLGMAGAIYAYNGYGGAVYFGEEMYEARTKMAWVIFASLAVGGLAEFAPIIAALAGAPDLKAMLTADAPFNAFLTAAGGPLVNQVVSLGVAFAIINAMIAIGLINARQLFCSGRDDVWPRALSRWASAVHPRLHSPWIATLAMGAATLALCFLPLDLLVILSGTNVLMLYAGVSVAVIAGRFNRTTAAGHYRMPLFPLWPAGALIGLGGVAVADLLDPDSGRPSLIVNLLIMALSAAYYLVYLRRRGGWALRGADGRTLEELEAEALASAAEATM
jgi:amino acid transporter